MGRIRHKAGLPSKIRIGAATYEVVLAKDQLIKDGSDGYHSPDESKIFINPELGPQRQWQVFVHELHHAMEILYNIKMSHHVINQLETAWYQVLKDNLKLFGNIK